MNERMSKKKPLAQQRSGPFERRSGWFQYLAYRSDSRQALINHNAHHCERPSSFQSFSVGPDWFIV